MKYILIVLLFIAFVGGVIVFISHQRDEPSVVYSSTIFTFTCEDNANITIQYDNSAAHAQLSFDGTHYDLNRARTASGAKYENASGVSFWEHQGVATVTLPGLNEPLLCGRMDDTATEPDKTVSDSPLIEIAEPYPNTTTSNPITLSGTARGYWFFEANAPVVVANWDGLIIGEGYITADDEWMTEDFVPFSGTVSYTLPADSYSASGTVIFKRSNPSDLPENDAAVEIPVTLEFTE